MNVYRHALIAVDRRVGVRIMSNVSANSPSIAPDIAGSEPSGVAEPISASPYSAKLLGWSGEELASSDFFRLVDAIRWLIDAEQHGAIARRAVICSSSGDLVWARLFSAEDNQRQRVMRYNALRILFQID
jgi:hypothetical protein